MNNQENDTNEVKKKCNKCKEDKTLDNYCKDKNYKDGHYVRCKSCVKIYKEQNKERDKKVRDLYYKENHNKILQERKEYRKTEEYKIKRKAYNKKRFQENKEEIYKYNRKHRNIPKNRLLENLRSHICIMLKQNKTYKKNKTISYLGCNLDEYKSYLESLFLPEFTWENRGEIWEIDHIEPLSKFDLTIEENIYKAFNYKNTKPIFKTSEIAKSFDYIDYIGNRDKSNN